MKMTKYLFSNPHFSKFGLLILLSVSCLFGNAQFTNPLFIPDTLAGPVYNLELAPGKVQFLPGDSTNTHGINQPYLGPTLIMNKGDFVTLNVTNSIPDTTTMHWHGMHVAPTDDGGPHTTILPGSTWSPDFTVLDEATTFWYHPHLHHKTALHVYRGAAGMIIVRDAHEATLNLPRTYGVDDFPIIIQDKTFDANNQLIFAAMNDTVLVNGTLAPFLQVPAQMVRFRLLNGSNQRVYNVTVPAGLNAWQIATDGGLLEHPLPVTVLPLSPGERAEIVIDFGMQPLNAAFRMPCNNSQLGNGVSGGPGGPPGPPGNVIDAADFDFMEFKVAAPTSNGVFALSPNLNTLTPFDEQDAVVTRIKTFDTIPPNSFPFYINSTPFNLSMNNDTVILDDIEIWEIRNETNIAHPFHIHDIQFYILDVNGNPPPPHMRGKKDVLLSLPGEVTRFITKFDDFFDDTVPYMFHCHNLFHEDAGMMGQFIVLEEPVGIAEEIETDLSGRFTLYPNPSSGLVKLSDVQANFQGVSNVELHSVDGALIRDFPIRSGVAEQELDLEGVAAGMYLLEIRSDAGTAQLRLVKGL